MTERTALRTKIYLVDEAKSRSMGPGPLELLRNIGRLASINKAAKEMNLSYAKALNMLNRLEETTGQKVVERTRGGPSQGGTVLTAFGKRYILEYERLEQRICTLADREYQKFESRLARKKQSLSTADTSGS